MCLDEVTINPDTGEVSLPETWRMLPGTNQEYAAAPGGDIVRLPRTVHLTRQGKPVIRRYPAKLLKQSNQNGYKAVGLTIGGHTSVQRVHRLICSAYHGPPPSLAQSMVLHGDGNPENNRPENLRWGTAAENGQDRADHYAAGVDGREYLSECPQGHDTSPRSARDNGGYCRRCRSEREKRQRIGKSAAWTVVRAFESAGVQFQHDGVPVEPAEVVRQLTEAYASGAFDTHPD